MEPLEQRVYGALQEQFELFSISPEQAGGLITALMDVLTMGPQEREQFMDEMDSKVDNLVRLGDVPIDGARFHHEVLSTIEDLNQE